LITQTLSHYRILQKLGVGGMGEVYLAEDTRLGRKVAIKLLPSTHTSDQERLFRFEQEARAASALNHPNIITIHEIGEAEAGRFIVMEYVQGITLRTLIGSPVDLDSLVLWGEQIAEALGVAHAAGIVHRDIKPENIMVREDGYVKVLDFGLARLAPQSLSETQAVSTPGALIGTARYMSPEQAQGEPAVAASDIFSFGIVLYELATGRHPFDGHSVLALLRAITRHVPSPPSGLRPEVPAALEAVILKMLEKDAQLRPSANDLARAFQEIRRWRDGENEGRRDGEKIRSIPPSLHPSVPPSLRRTVGREKERSELFAGFDSAVMGRGQLICIAGEPGIGKTALVEDFIEELKGGVRTFCVMRGRCSERLAGAEAYLPWLEALANLLSSESDRSLSRTMQFGRESATDLMKQLAPTWYIQAAPLSADSASETRLLAERAAASQERMKLELIALLQEISRSRPLVLFFDDLHWSDASTIDLLSYLAGKFAGMRILVIATYRPSDMLIAGHPFLKIKPDLQSRGACREIALEFLSRAEIEQYLAVEFPGHSFPAELPSLIYSKTEGNPLFMTDLARYLRDRGVISEKHGHWVLAGSLGEIDRELPQSVRGMIERKIAQLSEDDRRLLEAASVQGYEFDSAMVAEALEVDPAIVEERLEALERIHAFVRLRDEREFPDRTPTLRYRFVHILYHKALYDKLRPTRRNALSGVMARSLMKHYGDKSASVAAELAHLFATARDYARATQYYLIAARDAADLFAYEESAVLARRGLEMLQTLPETSERAQQEMALQLTLGTSLSFAKGHSFSEAGDSMTRARELCQQMGEPPELFTVIFALWAFYIVGARLSEARQMAELLLRMSERAQDPAMLVGAHYTMGTTLQFLAELELGHKHLEWAFSFYDPGQRRNYKKLYRVDPGAFCLSEMVRTLWLLGYPEQAKRRLGEAIEMARLSNDPQGLAFAMVKAVFLHVCCRDAQGALEWAEKCLAHCREHGIAQERMWVKSLGGWALAALGQVGIAISQMRESIDAYRSLQSELSLSHYLTLLADVLSYNGRAEEGLEIIDEALDVSRRTGDRHCQAETHRIKGELLLMRASGSGDNVITKPDYWSFVPDGAPEWEEAEGCFLEALNAARRQGSKSWELRAAIDIGRLRQRQGKPVEAEQTLSDVYHWFTEGFETGDLKEAGSVLESLRSQ
jgi:predicted ATPase